MGYIHQAIAGFSWQTVLKLLSALIAILKISILARLLTPDDFGLFSLTVITLGLSEAAAQTGINITILQSKKTVAYFLDTAWVISIIRGFVIAIAMILMGLGLSKYFANPELVFLVGLTSLVPIIKGFINPSVITMRKQLRFFRESSYQLALVLTEGALAVIFGFLLKSVTAMIISMIGAALVEVLISFMFFPLKPQFHYLKSRAQSIFDNAKWLSIASVLGYLNDNLDDFIIGRLVGTHQLGIYHNAYALSHKANYDLARSVHHGTFPIYTKMLSQPKRLIQAFFKTTRWSSLLLLAASIPLLLFPEQIVQLILGPQWVAAAPLIRWLTVAGIFHGLALLGYTLFLAVSNFRSINLHQLVNLALTVSLIIYFGQKQGLLGAVMGLAFGRIISLPIIIYGIYQYTPQKK